MSIRIVLVDDHRIVREGLRALLEKHADFEVVGEAHNGRDAVRLTRRLRPHVVVMDISMPDLNGVEATRHILRESPNTRVTALSMYSDRRFVTGMLRAGASGYLLKQCAYDELVRGVQTVADGHTYLSPQIADLVVERCIRQPASAAETAARGSVLTPREREVLQLLSEGHGAKQIAARLHVSARTIDTHRQHIMSKLDLHSAAELTKYAVREGLTSLEH